VTVLSQLIECHQVLFIGPWDLGNNLGYPVQGDFAPELKEAIARILKAAQDAGKKSGIYCPSGDFARRYADQGFQMVSPLIQILHFAKRFEISVVNDMTAIPTFMADSLSKAKGTWGHATAQAVKGAAYGAASLVTGEEKK
jgi:4-hydroxy-2-oxoheptanedioate aldolase